MPPPSPTLVSEFPDIVSTHPFNNLPYLTPEPVSLASLMRPWPYDTYHFFTFCPYRTDTDNRKLCLTTWPHVTHGHALEHESFCFKCVCPAHYPYGGNCCTKKLSVDLTIYVSACPLRARYCSSLLIVSSPIVRSLLCLVAIVSYLPIVPELAWGCASSCI